MESVKVRNLEQIEEENAPRSRLAAWLLAAMGGAAVVLATVMMAKRAGPPVRSERDPLNELVVKAKVDSQQAPSKLMQRDVSFPAVLSDQATPTTALAAVRDEHGRLVKQQPPSTDSSASALAPVASELSVPPLPVGALLGATPVTKHPKDPLTALAVGGTSAETKAEPAPPGHDSGYQIQVASFKQQADADLLVASLRKRGHRAFRQAAYVPGRGLWHRVRIGPFSNRFEAHQYQKKFEQTEHLSPYVVDPYKVEQAEELRAAKLQASARKN